MMHRKKEHLVKVCRSFQRGEYVYNVGNCWWNHTNEPSGKENHHAAQVFQNPLENLAPPDYSVKSLDMIRDMYQQMERNMMMITQMEQIRMKIY